jgi:cytochrome c553
VAAILARFFCELIQDLRSFHQADGSSNWWYRLRNMSMRTLHAVLTVAVAAIAAAVTVRAQQLSEPPPSWAYGVPPLPPGARPAGAPGQRGEGGAAGQPGQQAGRGAPDTSLKHIPDSPLAFTLQNIRDYFNVADWFPGDHPPPPDVILHGRAPNVRGCGMCHMPNGKGRPENAPVAGLPYAYIVQQLADFKNDLRTHAEPRLTNTVQMTEGAKAMTDEEVKAVATYFSSMNWTPWIRVVETDTVPKTRIAGNVFFPLPDQGKEPIGNRIIETPEDATRFELRDPHSGFIAYVPAGSLAKGAALVAGGGGKTIQCTICHGPDLNGMGPVPGIAGRSPSYLVRQLYDIKAGARKGAWSPLMKQVVTNLTVNDMLALGAYVASR